MGGGLRERPAELLFGRFVESPQNDGNGRE